MGVITLLESGFLYSDNFTDTGLSPVWDILPYDLSRVDKKDDRLVLKHGKEPIHVILSMLTNENECILDIKNSYVPTNGVDVGGIIVRGSSTESITVEEFYDPNTNETHSYPWVRIVRSFNNYSAYWSDDGSEWNLLGSSYFGNLTPKIGVYLGGDLGSDYELMEVRAFKRTNISVSNLTPGMVVNIVDENGDLLRSTKCLKLRDTVEINVADLPMPFKGRFQFAMQDGSLFDDDTFHDIYGGDKYQFNITPVMYYEHTDPLTNITAFKPLVPNIEEFMGYFGETHGITARVRMKVANPYAGTFKDTTVSVVEYLTEYHLNHVYLANDVGGNMGTTTKSLLIKTLNPNSESDFWIQMERGDITLQSANQLTFGLDVTTKFE